VVARVAVGLAALVVVAWLGAMERDARLQARGVAAAESPHVEGNLARAADDLRAARFLNPDTAPDVGRAAVYNAGGRWREAIALLADVLRREPDNIEAWGVLFLVARDRDPAAAARAVSARRRLDPLRARAR
jgi:predicted Zn-dependent protease